MARYLGCSWIYVSKMLIFMKQHIFCWILIFNSLIKIFTKKFNLHDSNMHAFALIVTCGHFPLVSTDGQFDLVIIPWTVKLILYAIDIVGECFDGNYYVHSYSLLGVWTCMYILISCGLEIIMHNKTGDLRRRCPINQYAHWLSVCDSWKSLCALRMKTWCVDPHFLNVPSSRFNSEVLQNAVMEGSCGLAMKHYLREHMLMSKSCGNTYDLNEKWYMFAKHRITQKITLSSTFTHAFYFN